MPDRLAGRVHCDDVDLSDPRLGVRREADEPCHIVAGLGDPHRHVVVAACAPHRLTLIRSPVGMHATEQPRTQHLFEGREHRLPRANRQIKNRVKVGRGEASHDHRAPLSLPYIADGVDGGSVLAAAAVRSRPCTTASTSAMSIITAMVTDSTTGWGIVAVESASARSTAAILSRNQRHDLVCRQLGGFGHCRPGDVRRHRLRNSAGRVECRQHRRDREQRG